MLSQLSRSCDERERHKGQSSQSEFWILGAESSLKKYTKIRGLNKHKKSSESPLGQFKDRNLYVEIALNFFLIDFLLIFNHFCVLNVQFLDKSRQTFFCYQSLFSNVRLG